MRRPNIIDYLALPYLTILLFQTGYSVQAADIKKIGDWNLYCEQNSCLLSQEANSRGFQSSVTIFFPDDRGTFLLTMHTERKNARPINGTLYIDRQKTATVPFAECGPPDYPNIQSNSIQKGCNLRAHLSPETAQKLRAGSTAEFVVEYSDGLNLSYLYSLTGVTSALIVLADNPVQMAKQASRSSGGNGQPSKSEVDQQSDQTNSDLQRQQEEIKKQLRRQQDELDRQMRRQKKEMERQRREMQYQACVAQATAAGRPHWVCPRY